MRKIELFQSLLADATPEELEKNHGDTLKLIAQNIIDMGEKILKMVAERRKQT